MAPSSTTSSPIRTLADLHTRLGGVPLSRILFCPPPGTATARDVIYAADHRDSLFELAEGVLVEKAYDFRGSGLAAYLGGLLNGTVIPRNLGIVTGADGAVELRDGLVRMPDVAFTNWDRLPGRRRPTEPIPRAAPNLVVEMLASGNTAGEMAIKRHDYFAGRVELVWEIDPDRREATVYTAPDRPVRLGPDGILDGGAVLPGFSLPLRDVFAELDRHR